LIPIGLIQKTTSDPTTTEGRTEIWKAVVRKWDRYERMFLRQVRGFFRRQQADTLRRFREKHGRKQAPLIRSDVIFDVDFWTREMAEQFSPTVETIISQTAVEWASADFDPTHPAVRAAIGERVRRFSSNVNVTTVAAIKRQLELGYAAGESIEEIANRIEAVFADATRRRARLIARTETYGAANYGTFLGAQAGGFGWKMWITSRDARVRESHRIDGQVKRINEPFELGDGRRMMFPQDFNERCIHRPMKRNPYQKPRKPQARPPTRRPVPPEGLDFSDIPWGRPENLRPTLPSREVIRNIPDTRERFLKYREKLYWEFRKKRDTLVMQRNNLQRKMEELWERRLPDREMMRLQLEIEDQMEAINEKIWDLRDEYTRKLVLDFLDAVKPPQGVPHGKLVLETAEAKTKAMRTFVNFAKEVESRLKLLIPEGEFVKLKIDIRRGLGRAFYDPNKAAIVVYESDNLASLIHEIQHGLEDKITGLRDFVRDYYSERIAGGKRIAIPGFSREYYITGSPPWVNPYQGKDYNMVAFEVLTMVWSSMGESFNVVINADTRRIIEDDAEVWKLFIATMRGWWQ